MRRAGLIGVLRQRCLSNHNHRLNEEFIEIANDLDLRPGVSLFAFEKLDEALILAKQNKLEQLNAVIAVPRNDS